MRYLLDIHSKPPMVVLASNDDTEIGRVGQLYADQVGRALVVATGPAPQEATFRPTIPELEPVTPPGASAPPGGSVERVQPPPQMSVDELAEFMLHAPGAPEFKSDAERERYKSRLVKSLNDSK